MKRILLIIGLLLLAGLVVVAAYLWTPSPDKFDRAAALETAKTYDVRIIRDAYGVPHIYGVRDADAAFGLAYAHAEDDLATMQDARRFTRGEMGLKTGREGAITDYLVAALGAENAAYDKYESDLSPETRAVIEGYADGINFYCAEVKNRCEPGFAPLAPQDIVSSFVSRTPFFYGLEVQLTELFEGNVDLVDTAEEAREAYFQVDNRIQKGSNAIAVAPSRSADGHTRLFVNSHQPFVGPVAWYEARVKSEEGWDMIGGLFPGTPLVSVGTNPDLGWAITVNQPDVFDVYKLTVDDAENPARYEMDGSWRDFQTEEITLRVKLFGPFSLPVKQTIRRSIHGPVFDTPNGFFAVSYAGDQNVKAVEQWLGMNKATTYQEWYDAMSLQGIPSFNFVYADKAGNIAYFYNANIPVRSANWDWSKVAPGNRSDLVWQGTRPFASAPTVVNPAAGYVFNANHSPWESTAGEDKPRPADYPANYGIETKVTNRGLRGQILLSGDDSITEEEFIAYKMDNRYAEGSGILEYLAEIKATPAIAESEEFAEALALFETWNRSTELDQRGVGLLVRAAQLSRGTQIHGPGGETPDPEEALRQAIGEYMEGFGRIDPIWGEVNRLKRGDVDLPLRGGPDTLRAIYSVDNPKDGSLNAIAGDSYILYSDWDTEGNQTIQTIHQYGAATLDDTSAHFADQTQLFADEKFKSPPMTLEGVLAEATADYRPGER